MVEGVDSATAEMVATLQSAQRRFAVAASDDDTPVDHFADDLNADPGGLDPAEDAVRMGEVAPERIEILSDLRYMHDGGADGAAAQDAALADARDCPEFAAIFGDNDGAPEDLSAEALFEELAELLAFEGGGKGVRYARRPSPGERSIWSRVVKARLRRLGADLDSPPETPWDEEDDLNLSLLARMLRGDGDDVEPVVHGGSDLPRPDERDTPLPDHVPAAEDDAWVAITGDARLMLDMLRLTTRWRNRWFVARDGDDMRLMPRRLKRHMIGNDGALRKVPDGKKNRTFFPFEDQVVMRDNQLGIRLIKIRLWQLGYYDGDLTGDVFGKGARWMFINLLKANEIAGGHGKHLMHFLIGNETTLFGINPHWLHHRVIRPVDEAAMPSEAAPSDDQLLAFEGRAEAMGAGEADAEAADKAAQKRLTNARRAMERRQREGILPKLFRTPFRLLRHGFQAVRRGLQQAGAALAELTAPLRNILLAPVRGFAKIVRAIRYSIRQFVRFIGGRPIGVAGASPQGPGGEGIAAIVTRFSIDRDAVTFATPGALSGGLLRSYRRLLNWLNRTLRIGLKIGVLIIRAFTGSLPFLGLLRLARPILNVIREALWDRARSGLANAAIGV